jgi:hypothetical protein
MIRRFRGLSTSEAADSLSSWWKSLFPPEPVTVAPPETITVAPPEPATFESGWTPTVPDNILTKEAPPVHVPRRSRESLQILEQLRDLATDRAEIERLNAYADHWHNWWNTQLEQARQQQERTEDMRASFAAFEWRILL